jgi:hypothetical protein
MSASQIRASLRTNICASPCTLLCKSLHSTSVQVPALYICASLRTNICASPCTLHLCKSLHSTSVQVSALTSVQVPALFCASPCTLHLCKSLHSTSVQVLHPCCIRFDIYASPASLHLCTSPAYKYIFASPCTTNLASHIRSRLCTRLLCKSCAPLHLCKS